MYCIYNKEKEYPMINSNAFNYVNLLEKAADASMTRYNVIANNIANNDTPNYKRKDVNFEDYLLEELTSGSSRSLREKVADVDLGNLTPTTYTDYSELSYRLDGNNVDIDTENVELASTQIKYNALIDSITYEFNMYKAALSNS
jgi:flagellar basal-body rod protein FlgB